MRAPPHTHQLKGSTQCPRTCTADSSARSSSSCDSGRAQHSSHEYGPHTVWLLARKPVAAFRHTSHQSLGGGAQVTRATREEGPTNITTTEEVTK
jgi:hypothetical protein